MRIFQNKRGAISVFLVIILVPCMLVASIFVDISRVQLAKAVAESSADLALSTLMSSYDYDLSQYYGLMGSCQNIDEYYAAMDMYFEKALLSQEVEDEEIKLLYQRVMKDMSIGSKEEVISDILQMKNLTEGSVLSALDGANMYNATILQKQVVEFMKYRGPIVILTEIVKKIKDDPSVGDTLESEENKELVDDKTDFYEAEGELLKTAYDIYLMTRDYTDKVGENGENMSAGKLQEYTERLKEYRAVYEEIHRYLVGNLFNTGGLTKYTRVTQDLSYSYSKTDSEIYSRIETPTPAPTSAPAPGDAPVSTPAPTSSPEPVYYIDGDRVTALLGELKAAVDSFDNARNAFVNAGSSLMNTPPGSGDSEGHAVQWWVKMNAAVNSGDGTNYTVQLKNSADAMAKAYAKVAAITSCESGNNMPGNWQSERDELLENVEQRQSKYLTAGKVDNGDSYLRQVNLLEKVSDENLSNIQASLLTVTVDGQNRTLENAVSYIQGQLSDMQATVRSYKALLDKLLDTSESGKSPLDQLYDLVGKYATTKKAWSDSANATDTEMGEEHREEIAKINTPQDPDKGSTEICLEIKPESVTELKSRLTNIRSQFQVIDDGIEAMKYGTRPLREIAGLDAMKGCARSKVQADSIGLTNQEVKNYTANTFSWLFQPASGDIAVLHDISDAAYNPLMSPVTAQVDTPKLYLYLYEKFKNADRNEVERREKDQEDGKKKAENAAGEAKDKSRYHGGGLDITPTESSKGDSFSLGSALSGLFGIVGNLFGGEFDNLRDDLYVTTYIMEMFSYATFENEGKYGRLDSDSRTELTLSEEDTNFYKKIYQGVEGNAETEGSWLSEKGKDSYNKTLTNRMINQENNAAYLAEVEYILYGKSNEDSVKAAYTNIYEIRYVLNLVSAFANFWSKNNNTAKVIDGIAEAVMTATSGVIPTALTKVILLPILTIFETCKDLDRLEAGFPVELYKSEDDWWYSFGTDVNFQSIGDFMNNLTGNRKNPGKGLQYSDYLTLFVYLGLSSGDDTSQKMYLRMADVIQANMRKATGKTDYDLAKTRVYFRARARLRVDPLMLALPYYKDYIEDPTMKDDWCTFEVETIRGY